jgi:metallo-beta-lactamase family protein
MDTSRLKTIFLVHGEQKGQAAFKHHLVEAGFPNVEIVKYGNTYEMN